MMGHGMNLAHGTESVVKMMREEIDRLVKQYKK